MPTSSPPPSSVTETSCVDTGDLDCTVGVGLVLSLWDVGLGVWVTGILDSVGGVMVSVSITVRGPVVELDVLVLLVGPVTVVLGISLV